MNKQNTAFELLTFSIIYSVVGLIAGLLYTYASIEMDLPRIGTLSLMAIWWLWFMIFYPPIVLFVTTFRATDPVNIAASLAKQRRKD